MDRQTALTIITLFRPWGPWVKMPIYIWTSLYKQKNMFYLKMLYIMHPNYHGKEQKTSSSLMMNLECRVTFDEYPVQLQLTNVIASNYKNIVKHSWCTYCTTVCSFTTRSIAFYILIDMGHTIILCQCGTYRLRRFCLSIQGISYSVIHWSMQTRFVGSIHICIWLLSADFNYTEIRA